VTLLEPDAAAGVARACQAVAQDRGGRGDPLFRCAWRAGGRQDRHRCCGWNSIAEGDAFEAALAQAGAMPLPPYIAAKRAPDAQDKTITRLSLPAIPGLLPPPPPRLHFDADLLRTHWRQRACDLHRSDAACGRWHLPAGQGRGCDHPPHACRMGRGDARGRRPDQPHAGGGRAGHRGGHHGAAPDRKRLGGGACGPGGARRISSSIPAIGFG
jgi:hypothetical protein